MIACLSVPYFVAAVERRAGHDHGDEPLAVGGQPWEARPVYAYSQEAASRGVRPGMSLRLVQLLSPSAHFLPAAAPRYAQVSAEIVDVLADFSPDIEPQELWHSFPDSTLGATAHAHYLPARYCLDLDGLPVAEAVPFVQEMGRQVRQETRFAPAIGLAAGKFAAEVAAAVCRPSHLLPVAAGGAAEFLSARPLGFLSLCKETARRLNLMGIHTLGQLAHLPLPALREQFGPDIETPYRLARGEADDPLRPQPAEEQEEVWRRFDETLTNSHAMASILTQIADELAGRLQATTTEGRTLHLTLETEDGRSHQQCLTLRRPTAGAEPLAAALREMAANVEHTCGVVAIAITATDLTPATAYQLTLFDRPGDSSPLYQAMQNLIAKYKTCAFYRPVLTERDHPLPERRFQLETLMYDPALA